jgi:PKD repeat protein
MTAAPSPGSSFAGWSGGGCSGTGTTCTITLNVDTTVTATFNIIAPVANFSASPITGSVPLTVTFTDLSTYNPTSWLWNFGDGTTSSLQNPSHIYLSQGPYTVSLTATNGGGPNTKTVSNYITVQACPNLAILQGKTPGYSTLQDAYNAASNGDVIQSLGIEFTGTQINPDGSNTLKINLNKTVTLNGGYNCGFTTNSGNMTLLKGILETYSTGLPITVGNFDLVQQ